MLNPSYPISATLFGAIATITIVQSQPAIALEATEISRIAKQFTVRIDGDGTGSGVIIERNGNTYTVLTNWHVVDYRGEYQVITPDGRKHNVNYSQVKYLPDFDLATIEFTSNQTYQVAQMGNSGDITEGMDIYMAGYPDASVAVTESVYFFDDARVNSLLRNPDKGYALVFNKPGTPGTSGGAILDNNARLVGINGRATIDGNVNRAFGLGIPIQIFVTARNNLKLPPGVLPPEDFADIGARLYREGKYEEAIVAFNQALEKNPNDYETLFRRGFAYDELGNYQAAIQDLNKLLELNPQDARVYNNRGIAYRKLGENQKAIEDYNQAIQINPQYTLAYNNRGIAYRKLGEYQKAIEDYNQAIQINPQDADAYYNRGNAYSDLREYQKAIEDYNQAIQINPQDADAYNNRGIAYRNLGEYQKAIEDYNQAIQINPQFANAYYNRGNAYRNLGEYQKAIEDYNRSLSFNPEDAHYDYYNRGLAYSSLGEYQKAIESYNQAIQINPQFANAYNSRGIAYANLGEYQKAIENYNQSIQINPQFANAYYNRGLAYKRLEDKQKAIESFRRAAELYQQKELTADYQDAINQINALANNVSDPPSAMSSNSTNSNNSNEVIVVETLPFSQSGLLEEGDRKFSADNSLYDVYTVRGYAGQSLIIILESKEFDTYLLLIDPNDEKLTQNDDISERNRTSRLIVTLPENGIYKVLVNAYNAEGRGRYNLRILE